MFAPHLLLRINREWDLFDELNENSHIRVFRIGTTLSQGILRIMGPQGTPYAGGHFFLKIELPRQYPLFPPHFHFLTPIYHPKVNLETGTISLDILTDRWSPVMHMRTVIARIMKMLQESLSPYDCTKAMETTIKFAVRNMSERTLRALEDSKSELIPEVSNKIIAGFFGSYHPTVIEQIPVELHNKIENASR